MAVLAELDHHHARPAAFLGGESLDVLLDLHEALVIRIGRAVDAGDRADGGLMAGEHLLHRRGNIADGDAGAGGLHTERSEEHTYELQSLMRRSYAVD